MKVGASPLWLPIVGLLAGIVVGSLLSISIPADYSRYTAMAILAGSLTFLGDRLGVELYYAAVVAFGVRLFNNLAIIRRRILGC